MNSRDKALRFKRLMPCEFDDEDVEDLIKLLDQHAAEQRQACLNAAINEYYPGVLSNSVTAAILNATGESDEQKTK